MAAAPYKLVSYDLDAGTSYYEAVPQNSYLGELTVDALTVHLQQPGRPSHGSAEWRN